FASAALGPWRGWVARTVERLVGAPSSTQASAPPAHARRIAEAHRAEAPLAPAAAAQDLTPPPPLAPEPPAPAKLAPAAEPAPSREVGAPPRARHATPPPAASEDTTPVMEAMRALRIEGNPVRARALLARYLERHPNGTLAEEALAMTIRAAV